LAIFVSFRLFDIAKLAPAKQLEKLPYGWGILLDDLAAAVYANIVCQMVLRFTLG
jgi:phosphatidylglycerophosphatase A